MIREQTNITKVDLCAKCNSVPGTCLNDEAWVCEECDYDIRCEQLKSGEL